MKKDNLITDAAYDRLIWLTIELKTQRDRYGKEWWNLISEQVTIHVPGFGLLGIEVTGSNSNEQQVNIDFYEQINDDWRHCWHGLGKADTPDILRNYIVFNIEKFMKRRKMDKRNQQRRKYRKGEPVRSMDELVEQEFVYWHDKIYARGWFMAWQMQMALKIIERGEVYLAIRKDEENG